MQEQQFQPKWDKETLRTIIKSHEATPQGYSEEYKELIRQHAAYYNLPFYEGEFEILDAIKEAGTGFVEGFTTLHLGDPPDNEYESMDRDIENAVAQAQAQVAGQIAQANQMQAQQQQAQQQAQDPLVQMQQAELQLKGQEAQRKAQKDQADIQLKAAELERKTKKDQADAAIDLSLIHI